VAEQFIVTRTPADDSARLFADAVVTRFSERGAVRVALAGGSVIDVFARARPLIPAAAWSAVRLTWLDERCVPFDDPDSTRGEYYRRDILNKEHAPAYELALFRDGETPEKAVQRVTKRLLEHFGDRLDVALVGVGEDGHIASIWEDRKEKFDRATAAHVSGAPKPPPERITLTPQILRTAGAAIACVTGEKKRGVVKRFVDGDSLLPLNFLPNVTFVTDLEVAP